MTDQSHAQVQASTSITTGVSALLKAKAGVTREQIMALVLGSGTGPVITHTPPKLVAYTSSTTFSNLPKPND